MKIKLLGLALLAAVNCYAVQITGFGTGDFAQSFSGFTTTTPSSSSISVAGTDDSGLYGSFATVTVGNVSSLYLTATRTSGAASNYQIELFDADGDSAIYQANLGSFTLNLPSVVLFSLVGSNGTFNGTAVSVGFVGAGSGSSTIAITLDNLSTTSAIPEPSTYVAIFGAAALGFVVVRRRFASK